MAFAKAERDFKVSQFELANQIGILTLNSLNNHCYKVNLIILIKEQNVYICTNDSINKTKDKT